MQQRNEVQKMKKMNITQAGADNLRVAIVNLACEDYIAAYCGSKVDNKDPQSVLAEVERFFRSEWFSLLSHGDIDPEACISVCKERARYAKWRKDHNVTPVNIRIVRTKRTAATSLYKKCVKKIKSYPKRIDTLSY